ncbi:hypothetical protein [Oribacterium sp. NK2B42]|uniref:hypothetical protein n=1 Tax=Oribacterium sp. NK2B42 TaxID=689781 RepID=UPI00040EB150|nr:hypothetical protein [Oribacterium sp. NK2B42]
MKNERVLSMDADSRIYHKPNCHYVKMMSPKNRMSLAKGMPRKEDTASANAVTQ